MIPEDITYKEINTQETDHYGMALVNNENSELFESIINTILEHLRNLSLPVQDIDEADVVSIINNLRIERVIPLTLGDGQTITYDDGETCSRSANRYIISHPRATTTAFWKMIDSSGEVVNIADIQPSGNQLVIDFMQALDEELKIIIF